MRPWTFTPKGPSTALTLGAAAARGVNDAAKNYMQARNQRMMMQYHQQMAQNQQILNQAKAKDLAARTAGGSWQDMQLLQAMSNHPDGKFSKGELKPLIQDRVEKFLDTAPVEMKQQLRQQFETDIQNGKMPSQIASGINFNANQLRSFGAMNTVQGHQTVAGIQAKGKTDAAQIYGDTRTYVADQGYQGKVDAAKITGATHGTVDQKANINLMNGINSQIKQVNAAKLALDKPPLPGAIPMDDATKTTLGAKYDQQLSGLHDQLMDVHTRISSGLQTAPQTSGGQPTQAPQAAQGPKEIPAAQWQTAKHGDVLVKPDGTKGTLQIDSNGKPTVVPINQQAAPQQAVPQQQQIAPPAPQMPQAAPNGGGSGGDQGYPVQIAPGSN